LISFIKPMSHKWQWSFLNSILETLTRETLMSPGGSNRADAELALESPHYSADEFLNALTHGAGLVLSIVGGVALVVCAYFNGGLWQVIGCSIYAMTLIGVYAASTLSHSSFRPERVRFFERLDQGFIYLLIVGTSTPFSLAYLRTPGWWLLFGAMWTFALCGFVAKMFFAHRIKSVAVWSYVLLGWMPILATGSLIGQIPSTALWWMLIGGLCYTLGTVFLVGDLKRFRFHAIWHLFVIAGSACHYFTILFFVAIPHVSRT
jgi:hemolysin III